VTALGLDFSTAVRFFARRKSAFVVIVITVALAIAANTIAFSVLRGFFFANLAVPDASSVVIISAVKILPGQGAVDLSDAYPNYRLLKESTHSFSGLAATLPADLNWEQKDGAQRVQAARVTASFFDVMGVKPCVGRFFTTKDEGPHPAPVAVISYKLWRIAFAGEGDVIGKSMRLNGVPHTIVGVMSEGFDQPTNAEVWLPFDLPEAMWTTVSARQINTYGRLAPGVTLKSANQELRAFAETAIRSDAANKDWSWRARSLREALLDGSGGVVVFVQIGAAVLLLLAICNLTSVLLAWAAEREHETALRLALGASSGRIVRQFLVQSLILVSTAGAAALLLARFALPALKHLNPNASLASLLRHVEIETGTIGFAAGVVLLTGLLVGLLPAWQTRSVSLNAALRSQSRGGGASSKAVRWQQAMIVIQAAISVLILVSALLAGIGLSKLNRVNLGFDTNDRVVFRIQFPEPAMNTHEKRVQFVRALDHNLAQEPSLASYGLTTTLPVGDPGWGGIFQPQLASGAYTPDPVVFHFRRVSPGYTTAIGIPLQEGRLLNDRDSMDAPPVALVSKALAKKYWPGESAIGRKLRRSSPPNTEIEVVGVVGDVHDDGPSVVGGAETVYVPFEQISHRHASVVLRARGSIPDAVAAGRRALRASGPDVAAFDVETLETLASQAVALPRLQFVLFASFALMAVAITALGAYGVMCQVVAVRENELAIRSALGATRVSMIRLIAWQNARLAIGGTLAGLLAAWLAAEWLQSTIPGFQPPMPWPFISVALGVLGITQSAGVLPIRRATRPSLHRLLGSA
jgi:putative ABC transport system permease protein